MGISKLAKIVIAKHIKQTQCSDQMQCSVWIISEYSYRTPHL